MATLTTIPYFALYANTQGYPVLVGLVLPAILVFRKHRTSVLSVLEAANVLVVIAGTISLLLYIPEWLAKPPDESHPLAALSRWFGPYGWASWLAFVSAWVPLIFWIRRLRRSIVCSIVVVLAYNVEWFTRFLAGFLQDYLPSTWVMWHPGPMSRAKALIIYAGMVMLTYLAAKWISRKHAPGQG